MKQISTLTTGFAVIVGVAAAIVAVPALAEDFTAGKTPAQLFRSDCGACHRSPNGLVKERGNVGGLTAFLLEHYTTKTESAAALAAYVSGLAAPGGGRTRTGRERRSDDADAPAPAAAEAAPADRPAEDSSTGRRRRATADRDRRKAHDGGDIPRPPRGIGNGSKPAPAANAPADAGQPEAGADPVARLRSYLSSGLDSENAQAGRTGAPRKRPQADDDAAVGAPAPADAPPGAEPPAAAEPATRPVAPSEAPGEP